MNSKLTLRKGRLRLLLVCLWTAMLLSVGIPQWAYAAETDPDGSLPVVRDGRSDYTVLVAPGAGPMVRHASLELVRFLEQMTGVELRRVEADYDPASGPVIVVGRESAATEALCPDIPFETLGDDGFAFCTSGENIVIAGATPRGTLYGVYHLLDNILGVRWFAPHYTYIPELSEVRLDRTELNQVHVPRFAYREIFAGEGHDPAFRQHNRLNGESNFRQRSVYNPPQLDSFSHLFPHAVHNFKDLITGERSQQVVFRAGNRVVKSRLFFDRAHPEFEYKGQVLLMNEEMRALTAERLTRLISWTGDTERTYAIGQNDSNRWDPDPESAAFAKAHGDTLAAPLLDMVIDVADRVREHHPTARFSTLAYWWSVKPPTGIEVPDYVQIMLAPLGADHGIAKTDPRNREAAYLEEWSEIANNILIWDYLITYNSKVTPYPSLYAMCGTIQGMAKYPSVIGYFGQADYDFNESKGAAFGYLRMWLASRLLWDPEQDCDELIAEFVDGYYGDAAPFIARYVALIHETMQQSGMRLTQRPPLDVPYFSYDVLEEVDSLFDQAEAAVADEEAFLRNVQEERLGVDYVILKRYDKLLAEAGGREAEWLADPLARLDRFEARAKALGAIRVEQNTDLQGVVSALRKSLSAAN